MTELSYANPLVWFLTHSECLIIVRFVFAVIIVIFNGFQIIFHCNSVMASFFLQWFFSYNSKYSNLERKHGIARSFNQLSANWFLLSILLWARSDVSCWEIGDFSTLNWLQSSNAACFELQFHCGFQKIVTIVTCLVKICFLCASCSPFFLLAQTLPFFGEILLLPNLWFCWGPRIYTCWHWKRISTPHPRISQRKRQRM